MKQITDFKDIKILFMDVDGVLTDGRVIFIGRQSPKVWNVRDRIAIKILSLLSEEDIKIVWISGRPSRELKKRGKELGVDDVFSGVENKSQLMEKILKKYNLSAKSALYIGDDLVDLKCIKEAGLGCCPSDAADEVKAAADYICKKTGGAGAVREIIEKVLKSKSLWDVVVAEYGKG